MKTKEEREKRNLSNGVETRKETRNRSVCEIERKGKDKREKEKRGRRWLRSKEDVKERVEGESGEGRVRQRQKDSEGERERGRNEQKGKGKSEQQISSINCCDNVETLTLPHLCHLQSFKKTHTPLPGEHLTPSSYLPPLPPQHERTAWTG